MTPLLMLPVVFALGCSREGDGPISIRDPLTEVGSSTDTDTTAPPTVTPDSDIPDTPCARLMQQGPTLTLGRAGTSFAPLVDDDLLEVIAGPQGGWHVLLSLRATHVLPLEPPAPAPSPILTVSLELLDGMDRVAGYSDLPRPVTSLGTSYGLDDELVVLWVSEPEPWYDVPLTAHATVRDECGVVLEASHPILLTPEQLPKPADDTATPDTGMPRVDTGDTGQPSQSQDTAQPAIADTGLPHTGRTRDTASTAQPAPFGAGFTEIALSTLQANSLTVFPGDVAQGPMAFPSESDAVFADLDGDGNKEVVFSRLRDPQGTTPTADVIRVFRVDTSTGQLSAAPDLDATLPPNISQIRYVGDVNGDAHLDLVSTGPVVFYGDGSGGYLEDPEQLFGPGAQLVDLDQDGWLDIISGTSRCLTNRPAVLMRTGRFTLTRIDEVLGEDAPSSAGYGALAVPFGPTEMLYMPQHTACDRSAPVAAFAQASGLGPDGRPHLAWFDPTPIHSAYKLQPTVAGGPISWANPMGAVASDLNRDGRLDLIVATSRSELDLFEGTTTWPLIDRTLDALLTHPSTRPSSGGPPRREVPWGTAALDLDRDGWPDIITVHGNDPSQWLQQQIPLQSIQVFRNLGAWTFEDVTDDMALSVAHNMRSLYVDDLDDDGDPDLSIGGLGMLPMVRRNDVSTPHRGFGIRLHGTTSNPMGHGARVTVYSNGLPPQTAVMGGRAGPNVIQAPILFFGLGSEVEADRVVVRWPTGREQQLTQVAAGTVHDIEEPPLITLSAPDRHLPADGIQPLTVSVTPRDLDGAAAVAMSVDIEAVTGPAQWTGPSQSTGGVWTRTMLAPLSPGETVIEVHIDGERMAIRPRVWWD